MKRAWTKWIWWLPGMAGAVGFDHGPLVQWTGDASTTASIRWIERAEAKAVEGRWAEGPSGFGYGDGDDRTLIPGLEGKDAGLVIRRKVHRPSSVPADARLYLRVNYDDGFIAWLAGKELARGNVETRDGRHRVPATHEAGRWEEFLLGRAGELLGEDGAVLALQGFNDRPTSSDFTLDVAVVAKWSGKSVPVVAEGEHWQYLALKTPEGDWKTEGGEVAAVAGKEPSPVQMEFRERGAAAWRRANVASVPFAGTRHRVRSAALSGLPAGREIEFRLAGGDGGFSDAFVFKTAPADATAVRFVTGGDMFHTRPALDAMNRRAGLEDPLFALLGGDLAYTNNANPPRWFEWIDSWVENARRPGGALLPMVLVIGNHETTGAGYRPLDAPGPRAATEYFSLFHIRSEGLAYDTFDLGKDLSFVLLDSGHSATIDSQTGWLESALRQRRAVKRLFVCYHRPAWGPGVKEDSIDIQRAWCPLFEKFRVDAVFENDHHAFSRSHPLTAGKIDRERGIPYLGAGAWGVGVRAVDPAELKKRPWIAKAAGVNHLYVVETGERGWSAAAKTADGKTFDRIERRWRR
ncbi:metallophosphoesterase family protein [Luteolibacter marinus]|uniref:metallophosphoesterase family protein n=1 Tax=Luteolibacter marinus TaxID=2776705 RepID=UPI0018694E4D|nr:metallophosphoesterase [Luteolibacter marinus]